MTQLTSPDNIAKWTLQDPGSFVQASQTQGDSVQAALANRQRYSYVWANDAARTSQTGMVEGSTGYQIDTQVDWVYRSSNWRIFNSLMQAYTPEFVNLNVGSGTAIGYVTVASGWANVFITVTLGSGFNITADVYAKAPTIAPINTVLLSSGSVKIGFSNYEDISLGASGRYEGTALLASGVSGTPYPNGVFRYGVSGGANPAIFNTISSTSPFTFVAGDKLHLNVNYPVQA
jgi:hypothetical protein